MPSEQSHREQAESNKEAADSIRNTSPDWAVTMCFYAALHWVSWYAKIKGKDLETSYPGRPSPHDRLYDYVRDLAADLGDRDLEKAYKNLKKASQTARYLEDIKTNSRIHYSRHNCTGVDKSFDNLQIVKQRLNS
ncbi:MAG: hypothetical protein WBG73_17695 [Coleofasciculaceae cyanobacterium]